METRLFFLLNMAQGLLYKTAEQESKDVTGFSIVQNAALLAVEKSEPCSQIELGKLLRISKSTVSGLAERMEKNNLIERRPDLKDARLIQIYLKPKGREALQVVKPLMQKQNARLVDGFSEEEIKVVIKFLNHISSLKPNSSY